MDRGALAGLQSMGHKESFLTESDCVNKNSIKFIVFFS